MTDSPPKTPSAPAPADPFNRQETLTADTFLQGIWKENPVFVMVLGMCPTLAVTNSAINALAMGLATTFVLVGSGVRVSLLRNLDSQAGTHRHLHRDHRDVRHRRRLRHPGHQPGTLPRPGRLHPAHRRQLHHPGRAEA